MLLWNWMAYSHVIMMMENLMNKALIITALLAFAAGCTPQPAAPGEDITLATAADTKPPAPQQLPQTLPPNQIPTKEEIGMTPVDSPSTLSGMESLIEKAREDLAERLSIETSQIELVEAREVTWPNASLGCPQPGMAYADVLTPGYLIILKANSLEFEYHASRGTEVIYCENPTSPVEGTPIDQ